MPDDRVEVRIVANTGGLQSDLAAAKAASQDAFSGIKVSAKDMAAALQQAGGDLRKMNPAMLAAGSGAAQVARDVEAVGPAAEKAASSTSILTRELAVLGREGARHNFSRMFGSLTILGTQGLGMSTAVLAATAAVAGLTAGLGYLVIKADEAANALDRMEGKAQFGSALAPDTAQFAAAVDLIHRFGDESTSTADKVGEAIAGLKNVTADQLMALAALITNYAAAENMAADKAAAALVKMFSGSESAQKMAQSLGGMTAQLMAEAIAADRSGDANQVFAAKLEAMRAMLARSTDTIIKQKSSIADSLLSWIGYGAAVTAGASATQGAAPYVEKAISDQEHLAAALKKSAAAIASTPQTPQQTILAGMAAGERDDPTGARVQKMKDDIAEIQKAIAAAQASGETGVEATLVGQMKAAEANLTLIKEEATRRQTEFTRQAAAAQKRAVDEEIQGEHHLATATQETARRDAAMAAEAVRKWQSVSRSVTTAVTQANAEIGQLGGKARGQPGSKAALDAQKAALDDQMAAFKASYQQVVPTGDFDAALQAVAQYNVALGDTQELMQKLGVTDATTFEGVVRDLEKARVAQAEYAEQVREAQQRAAREAEQAWNRSFQQIGQIGVTFVNGMLTGTRSIQSLAQSAAVKFAETWIDNIIKVATEWVAQQAAQTAAYLIGKTTQTGAMLAGLAAQEAADDKSKLSSAEKGAAAVYADVATIPYVGWILAPAAAAAAFAAMVAFDAGTPSVPFNMVAQIHQGEGIVPATFMDSIRSGNLTLGGPSGAGGSGGVTINLNAIDTQTGTQFLKNNMNTIVAGMQRANRNAQFQPT